MSTTTLRPGWWMTARAWPDVDGKHAWLAHDCTEKRDISMLPWPTWRAKNGTVDPSFSCSLCGLHAFVLLNDGPETQDEWPDE